MVLNHDSERHIYIFTNKGMYGDVNGSSVNTYTNVVSKNYTKYNLINEDAKYLEHLYSHAMKNSISIIATTISDIIHWLMPIINSAYNKQCSYGSSLLKNCSSAEYGCWNSFLNVNMRTNEFHRKIFFIYLNYSAKQIVQKWAYTQYPRIDFQSDPAKEFIISHVWWLIIHI